jgi:uncharacterized protein
MTACTIATTGPDEQGADAPLITSFLLKVASRCNLACDYCYMYEHADQSWRHQPKLMSDEIVRLAATRVLEHATAHDLDRVAIIFHGGEPLLAGADRLAAIAATFRGAMPHVQVDIGVQTNGTLLDAAALDVLDQADIGVSLSLDGPRNATDRHRLTHGGRSSHDAAMAALHLLEGRQRVFSGVIAVIDPANDPVELIEFFGQTAAPQLDLLLPDANHLKPPPGRDETPDLYERWLIDAFDAWFDLHPELPLRTFEAILDTVAGLPSSTDAFGFGDVSLLTIETDGSYHDLDVLKVTAEGSTALGLHVANASVDEAAATEKIRTHRLLLRAEGLSPTCRACDVVEVCGGGAVPHRYAADGFAHPTVYCGEMQALIGHARFRARDTLERQIAVEQAERARLRAAVDLAQFDIAEDGASAVAQLRDRWSAEAEQGLLQAVAAAIELSNGNVHVTIAAQRLHALPSNERRDLAVQPAVSVWSHVVREAGSGRRTLDLAGRELKAVPSDLVAIVERATDLATPAMRWHAPDPWLRRPFEDGRIVFEDELAREACDLGSEAFELIRTWRQELAREIELLSRDVLFVRDLTAHPDKVVSFSDDSAPGALYCSVRRSDGLISALDLADSLIHEHRHQKLYLLNRFAPLVLRDRPLVASPWREDMRPPSGLLHAVFVFTELIAFWRHVAVKGPDTARAEREVSAIAAKLRAGFGTLKDVELTEQGRQLVSSLEARAQA